MEDSPERTGSSPEREESMKTAGQTESTEEMVRVSGRGQSPFFPCHWSENEHVSKGSVWEGAPCSQAAPLRLPSDRVPEERQPVSGRKEEDVLVFSQMSTGHYQRKNQR